MLAVCLYQPNPRPHLCRPRAHCTTTTHPAARTVTSLTAVQAARALHQGPYGMQRYKLAKTLETVEKAQTVFAETQQALAEVRPQLAEAKVEAAQAKVKLSRSLESNFPASQPYNHLGPHLLRLVMSLLGFSILRPVCHKRVLTWV